MRRFIYALLLFAIYTGAVAQENYEQYRSIYNMAEENYNIGKLDDAERILTDHLKKFPDNMLQSAYRLLALCSLGNDNLEQAEQRTFLLLQQNPYYTASTTDPQRFIDMVERIKSGLSATITTASSQAETLSEVPVPTTLITQEMIRDCGGSNLQQVLAAYVPGMHIIDCNDDINIGMRGIYSNSQEKILIMVNGHRLNSYATNIAAPDYSISLEKIKQIEVLRGPASSLYGGVSLTAVVNIITWQGADIDGIKVKAGVGNYGQLRGDALVAKRYFDVDLLLWASIYRATGEARFVDREDTGLGYDSGDVTIGSIGKKPSFDVGLSLKYKQLQFFYNSAFSQIQAPMTMLYLYSPYNIEKFRTLNGIGPSFATQSHHANLSFQHMLGNVWLKGSITYDNSELTHYQVLTEEPTTAILQVLPIPDQLKYALTDQPGLFRYINGQEHTIGAKIQGDWSYMNIKNHKGLLTFGAEYSYFNLNDVRYTFGYNYDNIVPENSTIPDIGKGHESNLNAFVQLKHQWRDFILNAGTRFDFKNRYDGSHIREFSPRVALIYNRPKWNVKLSYSKSFIDAPYLYRKTNEVLLSYLDIRNVPSTIDPESLYSWQLSFSSSEWIKGLNFEVNGFYNHAKDLIFLFLADHSNAGMMDSYGIEFSGSYRTSRFSAHVNATWQGCKKLEVMSYQIDKLINTPQLMLNTILSWKATKHLRLHTHLQYYGKQQVFHLEPIFYATYSGLLEHYAQLQLQEMESPGSIAPEEFSEVETKLEYYSSRASVQKDYSGRFLVNVGANYTIGNIELGLDVHNLFNHHYTQSGMSTGLIPQKGLWLLGSISYRF